MSYEHPNEPETKAEYDDLDAATIYKWALETFAPAEKENLLQVAAKKGSAEANYALYLMASAKPGEEPVTRAFAYLVDSADNGNWLAQFQVAQIYAGKVVMLGIKPNQRKALIYFEKSRECSWKAYEAKPGDLALYYYRFACVNLAEIYLSGRGTVIREDKAFYFTKRLAYLGSRCSDLAKFYLNGIGTDVNTDEAYIWALIDKAKSLFDTPNEEITTLLNQITPPAKAEDRIALQKEASRRLNIIRERCLTDEDIKGASKPKDRVSAPNSLFLGKIDNLKDLSLHYYVTDGNITLKHHDYSQTFAASKLFNANCLELLKRYHSQADQAEPQICYYESTLYDARKFKPRRNFQIVSDFNHALRKLLGLGKDEAGFEWLGKGDNRSLRACFTLNVVY